MHKTKKIVKTQNWLKSGFTIVELIMVIAVIGILASIVIVSYGSWQSTTIANQLKSDLNGVAAAMESARTFGNIYPATVPTTFIPSSGVTLNGGSLNSGKGFCVDATNGSQSYSISQYGTPFAGTCPTLYLDASIGASYPGSGTVVTDLSGNGHNGTLLNGVGYSNANGGSWVFDGSTTDYGVLPIGVPAGRAFTIEVIGKIGNTAVANNFISANPPAFIRVLNNKVRWNIYILKDSNSTYSWSFNNGNINIVQDKVYDLVMTYDGANLRGYVNGSIDVTIPFVGQTVASQNIKVGYTTGGEDSPLIGEVYAIKVYNQVLSASEVQQNFTALRGRYGI